MKKLILVLIISFLSFSVNAGTLQDKASGFFGSTTNNFNMGGKDEDSDKLDKDVAGKDESIWNLDIYGMDFNLPHQPANQQFIPTITGMGLTYKFNEHTHLWGRYSTFHVKGVELEDVSTEWKHTHYVGGYGFRFNFGKSNRISLNLGLSKSVVEETKQFGKIDGLQTGVAMDVKYIWTDSNLAYGLYMSLVQVGSTAETWEKHHKGGYVGIGATVQIGLPNFF